MTSNPPLQQKRGRPKIKAWAVVCQDSVTKEWDAIPTTVFMMRREARDEAEAIRGFDMKVKVVPVEIKILTKRK